MAKKNAKKDQEIKNQEDTNLGLTQDHSDDVVSDSLHESVPKRTELKNKGERLYTRDEVKEMFSEFMKERQEQQNDSSVISSKKTMKHQARLHRIDGKWVVDFKDKNLADDGTKIDPYIKKPIHAFNQFNEQTRQFIPFITLKLLDTKTDEISEKTIALKSYLENRVSIYCEIQERIKKDASYSIGQVEIKQESPDGTLKGTGRYREQEVLMEKEIFKMKTPEGKIITVPDYAIS